MNPSVKRLLLSASGELQFTPYYADAIVMFLVSIFLLFLVRKREKDELNPIAPWFILVLIPYAALLGLASAAFTFGSYLLPFAVSLLSTLLLTSLMVLMENSKSAYVVEAFLGSASLFALLFLLDIKFIALLRPLFGIPLYATAAFAPVYLFHKFSNEKNLLYLFPVFTHLLDASSTFIALQEGLVESQFLAQKFLSALGPLGIFVMKFSIIVPISLYLNNRVERKYYREVLFLIGLYGLVLGFRNLFLILSAATAA
jgi:uncharacterized membrane protein